MFSNSLKYLFSAVLMASIFATPAMAAQIAYISDTLRVGVRPEPDNQVAPISVVTTGMKLEILERQGGYVRIRTDKGVTGWIKDIYVVETPPAGIQLKTLQDKYAGQEKKILALQESARQLTRKNLELAEKLKALQTEYERLQEENSHQQQAMLESEARSDRGSQWFWWLLAFIALSAGGFFSGISWYRQHIMKRLGGLRV